VCGIAGLIGVPGDNQAMGRRLLAALRHRGPDDEGLEQPSPTVTLVHTRLAVLDVSRSGHQPMADHPRDRGRKNWVVFNGEIFNYHELQAELADAGWPCRTRSDTEVILHAYRAWGIDCVQRFRGMFAIGLVDLDKGISCFYRDRLGIKPLYLYRPPQGGLVFASEIRALLALGPEMVSSYVNPGALESYFAQGAVQGYDALIRGITMLKPGTYLSVDLFTGRELNRKTYWQLPVGPACALKRPAAVERLKSLAREAIRLHLVSDVPIGLFLSGGIDSASIVAIASESNVGSLRTINVGFDVEGFDESGPAAATAAAFGSDHEVLRLTGPDVLAALPAALEAMDQPTVDGMNTYVVSQAARRAGLTVALSGLGGDELFGGYASFTDVPRAVALRRRFAWLPFTRLAGHIKRGRLGPKLAEVLARPSDLLTMYLLRRELFLPHERRALHPLPATSDGETGLDLLLMADIRDRSAGLDDLNRISFFELELYMRHMLLRDADAFSMAAPIEYRVPFLDHQLVELVFSCPGSWKRPDLRPKPLLLDIAGSRLPAAVWQRPKRGFTFPWGTWFAPGGALAPIASEAVHDSDTWRRLGLDPPAIVDIWKRFACGDSRVSPLQLLAFVTLRDFAVRHRLRAA